MQDKANMTHEQLQAHILELEQRLANKSVTGFKISDKGGVSVYGLGRFPVTLYFEQWMKLLDQIDGPDGLRAFLVEQDKQGLLSHKPENFKSQEPTTRSKKVTQAA